MKMRHGTNDTLVVRENLYDNVYRLPERMDGWTVVDVGAHIGTFAMACLQRGAAKVVCFEPESSNFALLVENAPGADCRQAAVVGNGWGDGELRLKVHDGGNTATHHLCSAEDGGVEVKLVPLDDVLRELGKVDLLKLDCEGAEYCILYGSDELSRVGQLAGEVHCAYPDDPYCTPPKLLGFLQAHGFAAEGYFNPETPFTQGIFFAQRASA